jgi:D-alanyl-D-alanine carboxypeptidase
VICTGCTSTTEGSGAPKSGGTQITPPASEPTSRVGGRHGGSLPTTPMSEADARAVGDVASAAFASLGGRAPALYVGLWDRQHGVFTKAYGNAVLGGAAASLQDSLRIGSITKTFTATAVLQLVAAGSVDLAAPVSAYLPELAAAQPQLADVTVEQLLAMRSGLPDYLNTATGIGADIARDTSRVWSPEELVKAALRDSVEKPGTAGYSNTNFIVLQMIAEKVSGKSLSDLIAEQLTGPLGMQHTDLPPPTDTRLPEPAAHGYLDDECVAEGDDVGLSGFAVDTDTTEWNTSFTQGAGGVIADLADLATWAESTAGTDLLPAALQERRLRTQDIGESGFEYGLGIMRFGHWYGHTGESLGWEVVALHNAGAGATFVAAANACGGVTPVLLDLLRTLYPDDAP